MKAKELKKLINQLDDDANVHFYILPIDKNLAEDNDANDIWLGEPQVICNEDGHEYMDFGFEGKTIFKECKNQLEEFVERVSSDYQKYSLEDFKVHYEDQSGFPGEITDESIAKFLGERR